VDPLSALLEIFLEIIGEALLSSWRSSSAVLILRGLSEVFDLLNSRAPWWQVGIHVPGWSDRLPEPVAVPAPTVSSFANSGVERNSKPRACGTRKCGWWRGFYGNAIRG